MDYPIENILPSKTETNDRTSMYRGMWPVSGGQIDVSIGGCHQLARKSTTGWTERAKAGSGTGAGSGDQLLAVVVEGDGVDGTGPGGELGVEFGVIGYLADEHALLAFLALGQHGLAGVLVALEGVPFRDALEHPDAGVPVVLDSHTRALPATGIEVAHDADVPETLEECYRAAAVASEVRGFDVWWDDDEADERAAELRATVEDLR